MTVTFSHIMYGHATFHKVQMAAAASHHGACPCPSSRSLFFICHLNLIYITTLQFKRVLRVALPTECHCNCVLSAIYSIFLYASPTQAKGCVVTMPTFMTNHIDNPAPAPAYTLIKSICPLLSLVLTLTHLPHTRPECG